MQTILSILAMAMNCSRSMRFGSDRIGLDWREMTPIARRARASWNVHVLSVRRPVGRLFGWLVGWLVGRRCSLDINIIIIELLLLLLFLSSSFSCLHWDGRVTGRQLALHGFQFPESEWRRFRIQKRGGNNNNNNNKRAAELETKTTCV